jgi:hypothetical protein
VAVAGWQWQWLGGSVAVVRVAVWQWFFNGVNRSCIEGVVIILVL